MIRFLSCLLLIVACSAISLSAQKPRSTLLLRMDDGQPLTVAVNNRYFNKTGTRLTIRDVPGRRPYLQVYRFRPYADGKGGKAELIFSGKIKIERGGTYDVVVHPEDRSVSVGKLRNMPSEQLLSPAYEPERLTNPAQITTPEQITTRKQVTTSLPQTVPEQAPWLLALLDKMADEVKDSEKLELALKGLPGSLNTTEAGALCDALLFEDNKLRFLKAAYPKIADRENFNQLKDRLWETDSKKALEEWLQSQ